MTAQIIPFPKARKATSTMLPAELSARLAANILGPGGSDEDARLAQMLREAMVEVRKLPRRKN